MTDWLDVLNPREWATVNWRRQLLEQNDEWVVQRCRYMTLESVSGLRENAIITLPTMAA